MAANAGIYQQYLNPVRSVAEYRGDMDKQEQNALTLAAGRLTNQQAQQTMADDQASRQASMESGGDSGKFINALQKAGLFKQAQAYQKASTDIGETQGKVNKQKVELVDAKLKQSRAYLESVTTPEQYIAWHEANHKDPVLGPELAARGVTAEQARASIMEAIGKPGGFEELLNKSRVGIEKFTELNKPTVHTQNLGGTSQVVSTPGMGGAPTVLSSSPITQDANSIASNLQSDKNNQRTVGASYANAAATREVAKSTRDAAGIQRDQATEMKLGDDYRTQSKSFKEVSDAYRQIQATLDKATTSPAATLAGATKFMKLLDPGSVVRESELGMALAATGAFDRATNYVESLKYGKVLTPNQVKDFKNITADIYKAAQTGQQQIDASYSKQAKTYNLRPEMILQDLGQNASTAGKDVMSAADAILKGGK